MIPYPLTFDPILKEKVWGGRRFEKLNKALPQGVNIGESWEIADLASTSADGAGGDEARSVIAHGPMRGITLSDAGNYTCTFTNPCGSVTSNPATVTVLCLSDFDSNTFVTSDDFDTFVADFELGDPAADVNHDGFVNGVDFDTFADHFVAGC